LTGTLPPELGNMKSLGSFDVHKNTVLGGDIPESFYEIKDLFLVDLSACNFTGTLSPMLDNLKDVISFRINDNAFTGTIPELQPPATDHYWMHGDLQVHNNNFQGKMPKVFCELGLPSLTVDCAPDHVTGEVEEVQCDCCTQCCDAAGTCTLTTTKDTDE
jgi:hypothetical protein